VIAGVGVDDAATTRRDLVEAAFVEGFEEDEYRTGSGNVLRLDQLLADPELTSCDVVLHPVTTMGMIVHGLETHVASAIIPVFRT
jgi:hypothetical protein